MKIIFAVILLLFAPYAYSTVSAGSLATTCQTANSAVTASGKWDPKHTEQIYAAGQCEGFIEGWLQAIDGSVYTVSTKLYVVTIKWSDMPKSMFTISDALQKYIKENPLESGKSVDTVLIQVLKQAQLLNAEPYITPSNSLVSDQ